jgi:hypothetical protein
MNARYAVYAMTRPSLTAINLRYLSQLIEKGTIFNSLLALAGNNGAHEYGVLLTTIKAIRYYLMSEEYAQFD